MCVMSSQITMVRVIGRLWRESTDAEIDYISWRHNLCVSRVCVKQIATCVCQAICHTFLVQSIVITVTSFEHGSVSNQQPLNYLFASLSRLASKRISTLRITDPLWRESTGDSVTKVQSCGKRFHVNTLPCTDLKKREMLLNHWLNTIAWTFFIIYMYSIHESAFEIIVCFIAAPLI